MVVTRRAFVGVGAAVGASYLAGRGFTRLAGAPLDASAESAGRAARLASVDGRLDGGLVGRDRFFRILMKFCGCRATGA